MTKRNQPELTNAEIAYALGHKSYCTGEACPYEVNTGMYFDWHAGFEVAEEESAKEDDIA